MVLGDDLKGQREALTEDVDGSGGEQDAEAADGKGKKIVKEPKMLKDSEVPCVMIAVLLLTFGAIGGTAIFVLSRAFGEDAGVPTAPGSALTSVVNASGS